MVSNDDGVIMGERRSCGSVLDLAMPTGGSGGGAYGVANHVVTGLSESGRGEGSGVPTREPPRWMISDGADVKLVLLEFCP